jgi:hypothetical protein
MGRDWPLGSHPGVAGDNGFNFNNGPSNSPVWDDFSDFGSLAFSATVSVPEPASWALMLVSVAGLGAALRASRKSIATAA